MVFHLVLLKIGEKFFYFDGFMQYLEANLFSLYQTLPSPFLGCQALRASPVIQWQLHLLTMEDHYPLIPNLKMWMTFKIFLEKVFMGELMGKTFILEIEKLLQEPTVQQVRFFTSNKCFINNFRVFCFGGEQTSTIFLCITLTGWM